MKNPFKSKDITSLDEKIFIERQAIRRFRLSLFIIGASLGILVLVFFLDFDEDAGLTLDTIFTAIVGLVGTWVGTIIAFYYTKDNFEAASRSTQELVKQVQSEKLDNILAREAMLGLSKITYLQIKEGKTEDDYLLKDILDNYLNKFNRLPVLASDSSPKFIIYESTIDNFISKKLFKDKLDEEKVKELKLGDLARDKTSGKLIKGFITVKENDSLGLVKTLMERSVIDPSEDENVYIGDAFVTTTGDAKGVVIGWLTNVDINKLSKV